MARHDTNPTLKHELTPLIKLYCSQTKTINTTGRLKIKKNKK